MENKKSPRMSLIHLERVTMYRGNKMVLDDFSWKTQRAENWFILGENGCGKTTLVEIIAGYIWPQSGDVTVLGKRYGAVNLCDLRERIGYVSPWIFDRIQNNILLSHVVASGLDASAGFWGDLEDTVFNQVKRLLRLFGINDLYDRPFGECSSGQQLKAILARALINRPEILILDEPFAQLDIGARLNMYTYLTRLSEQRRAPQIIMLTHHLEDVRPFFTHGMIMKEGKILEQGSRRSILNKKTLERFFGSLGF